MYCGDDERLLHADRTRYVDWAASERVLNEIIYQCQRSLEGIANAKIDQVARSWARGERNGVRK